MADAFDAAALAFGGVDLVVNNAGLSISKPLVETTEADWDLLHDVLAKGSFLVSQAAANVMVPQGLGGDIVYISSKNAVFAGPANIAYSAAKADQAHQVRLLAAELGEYGIRVNGINPDGVVRGSGIFANGWGAQRAAVYGVPEDELGAFYAQRTLLKREVLPEHVANASPRSRRPSSATPPGCTCRSTPAWPPPSSDDRDVMADVRSDAPVPEQSGRVFAAVDIGASGGRVMAGVVTNGTGVELHTVHRFANGCTRPTVTCAGTSASSTGRCSSASLRWPVSSPTSSRSASTPGPSTTALLDADGELLADPIAYRDDRTADVIDDVHRLIEPVRAVLDQRAAVPAVHHAVPVGRRTAGSAVGPRRARRAAAGSARLLAHRGTRHRVHQRLDDRPDRRARTGLVDAD